MSSKSIGTPCESFLFGVLPLVEQWNSNKLDITDHVREGKDRELSTGLYEIIITNWKLEQEVEGTGRIGNIPEYFNLDADKLGPYCQDSSTSDWDINDATHII